MRAVSSLPIIGDIYAVLMRRRWYFLVPFFISLIASLGIVLSLPKTYLSTGLIGVESQQIPEDFVRSTITTHAGERVGIIESRIMTNERLEVIVEKIGLYSEEFSKGVPMETLARKLKDNTWVEVLLDPYATQLGAIAFSVSFEHEDPKTAQAVASEFVDLFLEENVSSRRERAAETTEFLEKQASTLGTRAHEVDRQIAEFKQENRHALPEHLSLKSNMLARAESEFRAVKREISSLQQEKRFLETQQASANAIVTEGDKIVVVSPALQLEEKKAELAEKSVKYKPDHWDIRRLQAEIAALEAQLVTPSGDGRSQIKSGVVDAQSGNNSGYIRELNGRLRILREHENELRLDMERLQAELLEIPLVEIELRRLTDQYNVYMKEYSEIRAKKQDASLAQSLEQEQKAERFTLLESPGLPYEPVRSIIELMGMALLLSAVCGAGVAYMAELLDDRIYGRKMLASVTGQQPLAVIPYIEAS